MSKGFFASDDFTRNATFLKQRVTSRDDGQVVVSGSEWRLGFAKVVLEQNRDGHTCFVWAHRFSGRHSLFQIPTRHH